MKRVICLILLLFPSFVHAEEGPKHWQMIDAESSINFTVNIQGNPAEGQFKKLTSELIFDPENLNTSRANITIDLNYIEASYEDVAENLKKPEWFDVGNYPHALFVSRFFQHIAGNEYLVTGDLSLRGVTKSETLYFSLTDYSETTAAIKGHMKLNRLDYGVGQGGWSDVSFVAGQVMLDIVVKARRK